MRAAWRSNAFTFNDHLMSVVGLPDSGQAVRHHFLWAGPPDSPLDSRLVMQRQLSTPPYRRSLALFTAPFAQYRRRPFAPIPTPPFCPNTYAAPFSSPPPTLPKAVSSPIFFFWCHPPTPPPRSPSLRPPRCLTSLCAHPSDAKAVAQCRLDAYRPLSCARLAASCAARPAVAMCARHPISVHLL